MHYTWGKSNELPRELILLFHWLSVKHVVVPLPRFVHKKTKINRNTWSQNVYQLLTLPIPASDYFFNSFYLRSGHVVTLTCVPLIVSWDGSDFSYSTANIFKLWTFSSIDWQKTGLVFSPEQYIAKEKRKDRKKEISSNIFYYTCTHFILHVRIDE